MMVAKIIIADEPIIMVYPDLGDGLDDIRFILPYMGYEKEGIHFLDIQPGIGKTHAILKFLEQEDSFLVVTGTHKLLKGEYGKLGAVHWRNFKEKCTEYPKVKKMKELGVPINVICDIQGCKKDKCPYWKQFDHPKAIAPYHFLTTNRIKNKEDFKFDLLVVDEAMTGYNSINMDINELKAIANIIKRHHPKSASLFLSIIKLIEKDVDAFDFIQKNLKEINRAKSAALKKAIKEKKWNHVEKISSLNVFELKKFAYYKNIHPGITHYDEPLFYEILDLARQGIPIILLDANFDQELFRLIYGRYAYEENISPRSLLLNKELKPLKDIKIAVYQSNQTQKEKKIHRMDKDNYYYKSGFFNNKGELTSNGKKTIRKLKYQIKRIKRIYPNVGIVTYQKLTSYFSDLGKTEYFFNLRGSNKLENCEALFIIGTPQSNPTETVKEYNKLAMTDIDPKETYKRTYTQKDGELYINDPYTGEEVISPTDGEKIPNPLQPEGYFGSDCPEGKEYQTLDRGEVELHLYYPLSNLDMLKSESEQYQAIHRARPLINNKKIYAFGNVPQKIKDEFTIKTLDKKQTNEYIQKSTLGVYPLSLWQRITELYSASELKSLDIAKKLKLYKKDKSFNTPFITAIIKGKVSLSDIKKIDKLLKEKPDITASEIKRKHRKLDKDFIEYCIYYAKEGEFIKLW